MDNDFIIQSLPLLIVWVTFALVGYSIGKRKGVKLAVVILGTFPIWVGPFIAWLASQTDKDVLERLKGLEDRVH